MLLLLLACHAPLVLSPPDSASLDSASSDSVGPLGETSSPPAGDTAAESVPDAWVPPVWDPYALPESLPVVEIQIDPGAMERLDADPFHAADERGVFVDGDGQVHEVDLTYRGAYELQSVMSWYDLRNWKVKFDADDPYQDRREWNFNYEPDLVQKLAYDLMRFAGVPVPGAQHVVLHLNGVYQGLYLQYEDPDNAAWLWDSFGDDQGDLLKAAYDLPGEPQCFADLTVLGPTDADYACHYTKKTNEDTDLSALRAFLEGLETVPDDELADWLESHVDLEAFRSYLVVSNFIANWDSYPQRPKNFWLYEDRRTGRMVFEPWDLNGTFNPSQDPTYNQMGTSASIWYNLENQDYTPVHDDEGAERPLVRRMMALPEQRDLYLARYRELSQTLLTETWLLERMDALTALVEEGISHADRSRLESANASQRTFVERRVAAVGGELD